MSKLTFISLVTIALASTQFGVKHHELSKDLDPDFEIPKRDYMYLKNNVGVPDGFDSREKWPGCIHITGNQNGCIASWAFSAAEVLSDRLCVQHQDQVLLSPEYLINCVYQNDGCTGGKSLHTWQWLAEKGVPSNICIPYTGNDQLGCPVACTHAQSEMILYRAANIVHLQTEWDMKFEIMRSGPISATMDVYEDFLQYNGGIYGHQFGELVGEGHGVKIIGWGTKGDTEYWIAANSYGTAWGEDGYFKIAFNQCRIQDEAYAGDAEDH